MGPTSMTRSLYVSYGDVAWWKALLMLVHKNS
jgi:hypothetical protein